MCDVHPKHNVNAGLDAVDEGTFHTSNSKAYPEGLLTRCTQRFITFKRITEVVINSYEYYKFYFEEFVISAVSSYTVNKKIDGRRVQKNS